MLVCEKCGSKADTKQVEYYHCDAGQKSEELCAKCIELLVECAGCGSLVDDADYVSEADCVACESL